MPQNQIVMNKLEILYSLTAMGYHFLLPEGPENLSDGRVRWHYTAYKQEEECYELNRQLLIRIDSPEGEDAIEDFITVESPIFLYQGDKMVIDRKGDLNNEEKLIKFKI